MALAIDASTPAVATQASTTIATVTTASFTAPANSRLLALWSGDTSGADPAAPSIADSGGLSWGSPIQWRHRTSGTPTVDGQVAIWSASPGSSAARTVTVTTGSPSGNRDAALALIVLTDTGTPSIGTSGAASGGTGTIDMTSTYTGTAAGAWGFMVACDWDVRGAMTAGTGMTLIGTGSLAGAISYGMARRATADGTNGGSTTVSLIPGNTTANATWAYVEIVPNAVGGGGTAAPGRPLVVPGLATMQRASW